MRSHKTRARIKAIPLSAAGGGGGGSGARAAANGDNGLSGDDESSLDGDDGLNFDTAGGIGGDAGTDGSAGASGSTVGELELSPDDQGVLSWSFIHNQAADLDLAGGGGGGGGSAGIDGACFNAGSGGDGGAGANARGIVTVSQTSTVAVTATLSRAAMSMATPTTGRFLVDIGWTSTAAADLENGGPMGDVWVRNCDIVISHSDGATLTISNSGQGQTIDAYGTIPGVCCPFTASSNATNDSVTGELIVGFDDFVFNVTLNSAASILANNTGGSQPVFSSISGDMTAAGGGGAEGGAAGGGFDGSDGSDEGSGPAGGNGGTIMGAADGGDGGSGDAIEAHEDGIFQGVIEVWVDN
jgi:hypothetical protein